MWIRLVGIVLLLAAWSCRKEEPVTDTTLTAIPTEALTTVASPKVQSELEAVDLCELVSVDEISTALEGTVRKSRSSDGRCHLSVSTGSGVADQYTAWLTPPATNYGASAKGLAALVTPSEQLATIVGTGPLPRSEVTKRVWDYVRTNRLQDQNNKRMINADARLRVIFGGRPQVSMFEMTALVNKHLTVPEEKVNIDGLGDGAYLNPAAQNSGWTIRVVKRDRFQLYVTGRTRDGVLKIAHLVYPKVKL